jgi:flagellar basal-body rod protein FlgC
MNLSHMDTTRTPQGGPYRRKLPIFTAETVQQANGRPFKERLDRELEDVRISEIIEDPRDFQLVFNPAHPDADEFGYVQMPNINVIEEMVDMLSAKRSYEANVTAVTTTQNMALKALEILN